jgi:protein-disulfide isomerase
MKYIVALTALFCVGLIGLGYFFTTQDSGGGPRIVPVHASYSERINRGSWTRGTDNATVVVTEYSDYQCPGCRTVYSYLQEVEAATADIARFEFHHFPLNSIHNKAMLAAQAAEAAGRQGKFWEMNDLLFARQLDWRDKTPSAFRKDVEQYAVDTLQLSREQFKRDMSDPTLDEPINRDIEKAQTLQLPGTPSFLLNGKPTPGMPQSAEQLIGWIQAVARGEELAVPDTPTP